MKATGREMTKGMKEREQQHLHEADNDNVVLLTEGIQLNLGRVWTVGVCSSSQNHMTISLLWTQSCCFSEVGQFLGPIHLYLLYWWPKVYLKVDVPPISLYLLVSLACVLMLLQYINVNPWGSMLVVSCFLTSWLNILCSNSPKQSTFPYTYCYSANFTISL